MSCLITYNKFFNKVKNIITICLLKLNKFIILYKGDILYKIG
jgi:hypothetical protein